MQENGRDTNGSGVEDGTSPIRAVLDVGNVALALVNPLNRARLVYAFLSAGESVRKGRTSDGRRSKKNRGEQGGKDHDELVQ